MKKFATLAVLAALATSAQAASVLWGFGGKVYLYDGKDTVVSTDSSAPAVDAGSYLALVYLGQNVTSYSLSDITETKVVDQMDYGIATTGKAAAQGKWNPNTSTYNDASMASGASFTVLFFNGETSSFDYIYAYSGSGKGDAISDNILTITSGDMAIADGTIYGTKDTSGTAAGVVAVPEPSVALMGLLGIGMLLKRRRA